MDLEWLWLIIPGSYILISTILFWFPTILHKKYEYKYAPFNDLVNSDQVFCIGHRGGGWQGPENTIQLFQKNDDKVHMFELDVCLTKDNQLVVNHDSMLTRNCGVQQSIQDLNYEDLPRFKSEFQSFGGSVMKSNNNKIPLLEELFQKFPKKPMNIELKTPSQISIKEFSRLVRKYKRQDITVWGVAGKLNEQLREENPDVVNFYSGIETLKIYFLFLTGLLPFVCIRQGVLDIPLCTDAFYKMAMNFGRGNKCTQCLICFAFLILRFFNCCSWFFIRHLKKRGILTFYFILNTQQDFESALSKGSSGIMTDLTADLRAYLYKIDRFYQKK